MIPEHNIIHHFEDKKHCSAVIDLSVGPEHIFFDGHFDTWPVLPGVVQIYLAEQIAKAQWNTLGQFKSLLRIKFKDIISPNELIKIELNYDKQQAILSFQYTANKNIKSSGKIQFNPPK